MLAWEAQKLVEPSRLKTRKRALPSFALQLQAPFHPYPAPIFDAYVPRCVGFCSEISEPYPCLPIPHLSSFSLTARALLPMSIMCQRSRPRPYAQRGCHGRNGRRNAACMNMSFFRRTAHPDIRVKSNHSHRLSNVQTWSSWAACEQAGKQSSS